MSSNNKETVDETSKKNKTHLIRFTAIIIGMACGIIILPWVWKLTLLANNHWLNSNVTNAVIGGIIFYLFILIFEQRILNTVRRFESSLKKKSLSTLFVYSIGLVIGLVVGSLFSLPLYQAKTPFVNNVLPAVLIIFCGYFGYSFMKTRGDEFANLFLRHRNNEEQGNILERKEGEMFRRYKILDTSVIIDGRIYDIAKTGFIDGTLLIPKFVLYELQYIADSADSLKRVRGRRGLDILNELQKEESISVEMYEGDFDDIDEVDTKLIKLAKLLDGVVVTNDYNLNKVCEFQRVPVLNINALANAVKPVVIPGQTMVVKVVKEGTEREQGVAYLDDGTMIVVEDGKHYMNQTLSVVVTSALQTAAGRMIFARPSNQQRHLKEKS